VSFHVQMNKISCQCMVLRTEKTFRQNTQRRYSNLKDCQLAIRCICQSTFSICICEPRLGWLSWYVGLGVT